MIFTKKENENIEMEPFDEEEDDSSGSRYIVIPIIIEIVLAGLLWLRSSTAAMNYLYALIPLLLGTSLVGTYVYNRNGDMKLFSAISILTSVGAALQILVDQIYNPLTAFSVIKMLIALAAAILFVAIYHLFRRMLNHSFTVYLMMILCAAIYVVLLVRGYDPNGYGTSAWIAVGGYTFQLTDATKVAAVLFYSALFSSKTSHSDDQILILSTIFFGLNLVGSVLIKELGSFFILYFLHLSILYIFMQKGMRKRIYLLVIFFATVGALALVFLIWRLILPAHEAGTMNSLQTVLWPLINKIHTRFSITANINSDPYGAGYQLLQGKKAMWMAGWFGNTVNFSSIPVAESDMAFIAMINAFGWLVGFAVVGLFFRIMVSGSELARKLLKHEKQDAVVVYGATVLIVMQAAIVILGSCNVIPFTGLPIPFLSRGFTYMTIVFCFAGLLLHMSENAEEPDDYIYDSMLEGGAYSDSAQTEERP